MLYASKETQEDFWCAIPQTSISRLDPWPSTLVLA